MSSVSLSKILIPLANTDNSIVWAEDIDSAIDLLEKDESTTYEAKFMKVRVLALLKTAKVQLK